MKNAKEFKVIECVGTPYEIGRQWGEGCKENILKSLEMMFSMMGFYRALKKDIIFNAMQFLPKVKEYDPYLLEILQGQADGAGIKFEEIFTLRCLSELTFYYNKINFCTSFAATGEATQGGKTLLGQTIDWFPGTPVDLVKIHHSDGLVQFIISIGNFVDYTFNSAGFGMCANATIGEDYSFNIPLGCYLPKVMRQKNLHNAMDLLKQVARGIAYYHLADSIGKLYGIESVNNDFEIIHPDKDMLFHSNHYITERFKKGDLAFVFTPDSFYRLERIRSLANQNYGKINLEIAKEILTDHDNFPNSICHHVDETKQFPSETIVSYIMIPEERSMYITCGNPCEYEYIQYKF